MQRVLGKITPRLNVTIQGPRAQVDRKLYKRHMQETLFNYPNLDVRAGSVFDLILDHTAASNGAAGPTFAVRGIKLGNELQFDSGYFD
jgi:tRNA uridine 5-carboxymethylaminomethyl modification enzyme